MTPITLTGDTSCGNLHEYWEIFRDVEGMQGGFIWDFVDQGRLGLFVTKYLNAK